MQGKPLKVRYHFVDLGFSFTDFKMQGLTVKKGQKLILVLNRQTAKFDIGTISVGLSRVTRIEDIRILPLDLDNPADIKHLLR